MKSNKTLGFTLVELIISVSILTIISLGIIAMLKAGLDAWIQGEAESVLQSAGSEIFNTIIEGNFKFDGVRESLDVLGGEKHRLVFVPWWEQNVVFARKGDKIKLNRRIHEFSPVPILQVFDYRSQSHVLLDLLYFPNSALQGDQEAYVKTDRDIAPSDKAKLFYYPEIDTSGIPDISMVYEWDASKSALFRTYQGRTENILKDSSIRVQNFHVSFLNGLNKSVGEGVSVVNFLDDNPISAIRLNLTLEKNGHILTFRTFASLRKKSQASAGVLITPGGKMRIPNSVEIKTFSIIHFGYFSGKAEFKGLITSTEEQQSYLIQVDLEERNAIPFVTGYHVECPRGKKMYENRNQFPASRGLNLLTLDHSGRYDYGADGNVDSEIQFKGDHIQFEMLESTLKSVRVIVR